MYARLFVTQEDTTYINVRSYWPSVVASGTMLLASDALSTQRTVGFYMLTACDFSKTQLADFAHFHGSSESLLMFAMSYDERAAQMLDQRVFDTSTYRNVTELRKLILHVGFHDAR